MNTLTTVHKNGIVSRYQIVNDVSDPGNKTQTQLIWNDEIHCIVIRLNTDPVIHDDKQNVWSICDYRAIYLDNILIVKGGKVWPRW